jgi:hypothetical protein
MSPRKHDKYIITECFSTLPAGVLRRLEKQGRAGNYVDSTRMLSLDESMLKGSFYFDCVWLWEKHGSEAVQMEIAHTHDFDEILGFVGCHRENPRDLNAEIELWLEDEKYIITESSLVFVPRGMKHLPLLFHRIDSPIFFFTGGNGALYGRTSGKDEE